MVTARTTFQAAGTLKGLRSLMAYGDTRGQCDRYATADARVAACPLACISYSDDSTRSVAGRTHAESILNDLLTQALAGVAEQERIVLQSDEGIAVVFLTDSARCLGFGLALRDAVQACSEPSLRLRVGIHWGSVRVVRNHHGEPQFDGEGLEAGWRIVSHAQCGQIAASASFLHAIGKHSPRYQSCFAPLEGHNVTLRGGEALYEVSAAVPPLVPAEGQARPADEVPDKDRSNALRGRLQRANRPALATALAVLLVLGLAVLLRQLLQSEIEQVATRLPAVQAGPSSEQAPGQEGRTGRDAPVATGPTKPASEQESTAKSASLPLAPATGSASTVAASAAEPAAASKDPPSAVAEPPFGVFVQSEPGTDATVARAGPSSAQTRRQPAATGAVRFSIVPWGEIYVDGKRLGAAPPLRDVALQPGMHRIEVRNPGFAAHAQVIQVRAGEEIRIRHRFE